MESSPPPPSLCQGEVLSGGRVSGETLGNRSLQGSLWKARQQSLKG
jgi:hypothetical protein